MVRLFGCWAFRHNLNLDAGVVALMARHIAEGSAFPVFFYGQAHMGSLEAVFSGFFCRLFGISGFAVCLGTAFVSFWLLPIAYLWARGAGGRAAGYATLAFLVIGPGGFFHYNASPRGAYASALTLGAFVLWYATRMAIRWSVARRQSGWDFLFLGLGSGLAWWNSQLTAAAILAAGLLLLVCFRRAVFSRRLVAAAGGFLAGSAPFWIYNAVHGWPSLAFTGTFGRVRLSDGLTWFFRDRLLGLLLPGFGPAGLRSAVLFLIVALALFSLFILVRAGRKGPTTVFITLLGILIFTAAFALLYASSHFAALDTPRYALPMVAPFAVLLGLAVGELKRRVPVWLASAPIVFLIFLQVPVLDWARSFERAAAQEQASIEKLGEQLEAHGVATIYAVNRTRSWNFALRERFVFVDLVHDFYRPHQERAEAATEVAVLDNYGAFESFLRVTGGRAERFRSGPHTVHHRAVPPALNRRLLPEDAILRIEDPAGEEISAVLLDGRHDTEWLSPLGRGRGWIEVVFSDPARICGFRLISSRLQGYPSRWSADIRTPDGDWRPLFEDVPLNHYFWSGPRFFWGAPFFRLEARMEPLTVTALRIRDVSDRPIRYWSITQLQIFTPASSPPVESEGLTELLDLLRIRRIRRLYCDRWMAHRVYEASEGAVATPRIFDPPRGSPELRPEAVRPDPATALLVLRGDAPAARRRLRERLLPARETVVGPWILFDFPPDRWEEQFRHSPGLLWFGWGLLLEEARWPRALLDRAEVLLRENPGDERIPELLQASRSARPGYPEALDLLHRHYRYRGDTGAAEEARRAFLEATEPAIPAPIRFRSGLELLGYNIERETVEPGQTLVMSYYWRLPPRLNPADHLVFVQFRRGAILFADDHILLEDCSESWMESPSRSGIFRLDRVIEVPEGIAPGPVDLVIGIYDRRAGRRARAVTKLARWRSRAFILPGGLTVE